MKTIRFLKKLRNNDEVTPIIEPLKALEIQLA